MLGEARFNKIISASLQLLCLSDYEWFVATLGPMILSGFYACLPGTAILQLLFLKWTGRPYRTVLLKDTIILDLIIVLICTWFALFLKQPLDEKLVLLRTPLISAKL